MLNTLFSLALLLTLIFSSGEAFAGKRKTPIAKKPVSSCMSAPSCGGEVLYSAPYGVGINLQECHQSGGQSIRGEKRNCYNLQVNVVTSAKPAKRRINIGETCYDMECDCVNGLTTYSTQRCGE